MIAELGRNWWTLAIRGVVAIVFGILALLLPGLTLGVLIALFAINALFHGAASLVLAFQGGPEHRWPFLVSGIVAVLMGVLAIAWPGLTALSLLLVIAAWAIVTGVAEILAAIRLRGMIDNEWPLALNGIVSIVFGIYLVIFPGAGALALIWLIGSFAIVSGVLILLMSFRLRAHGRAGAAAV